MWIVIPELGGWLVGCSRWPPRAIGSGSGRSLWPSTLRTVTIEDGLILPIVDSAPDGKALGGSVVCRASGQATRDARLARRRTYGSPVRIAAGANGAAGHSVIP